MVEFVDEAAGGVVAFEGGEIVAGSGFVRGEGGGFLFEVVELGF